MVRSTCNHHALWYTIQPFSLNYTVWIIIDEDKHFFAMSKCRLSHARCVRTNEPTRARARKETSKRKKKKNKQKRVGTTRMGRCESKILSFLGPLHRPFAAVGALVQYSFRPLRHVHTPPPPPPLHRCINWALRSHLVIALV